MGVWKGLVDQREDKKRACVCRGQSRCEELMFQDSVVEQEQENQHLIQSIEEIKCVSSLCVRLANAIH